MYHLYSYVSATSKSIAVETSSTETSANLRHARLMATRERDKM